MTGQPIFSRSLWFGNHETFIVFRKSGVNAGLAFPLMSAGSKSKLSELKKICSSPEKNTLFSYYQTSNNKEDI